MKIIIDPETDEEKEQFDKNKIFQNVFEFVITGRCLEGGYIEAAFSHMHVSDSFVLRGKLFELIERLRDGRNSLHTD